MNAKIRIEIDHPDMKVDKKYIKKLAENVARDEQLPLRELTLIISTDEYLKHLQKTYLHKIQFTDVITFNLGDPSDIEAEIYISADMAKVNAKNYGVDFENEVSRLVIHGILHLKGYQDSSSSQRKVMQKEEERYLEKYHSLNQ
jgi:rRNA maturation RNase YbeY